MAYLTSHRTSCDRIQNERFTAEKHGYRLVDIAFSFAGNIAVSGCHNNGRTFIDIYFGRNSGFKGDKLKLFYSKEFRKHKEFSLRFVSFLESDCSKIVTCIGDKIEILDSKHESKVLRTSKVDGEATCLTVREGGIFVGLIRSKKVVVLNDELNEMKNIVLQVIRNGEWLSDLQVTKDSLFALTVQNRVFSTVRKSGKIQTEYKNTTCTAYAHTMTINENLGLVAILWGENCLPSLNGCARIFLYPLKDDKPLLVLDSDCNVSKIRISDREKRLSIGNRQTGEVKVFKLAQLFTYENMVNCLASLLRKEDCMKLVRKFTVREDRAESVMRSETPSKTLLLALEDAKHIQPSNVERLSNVLASINRPCYNVVEIYKATREYYRAEQPHRELQGILKTEENDWKDERRNLIHQIHGLQEELQRVKAENLRYAKKIEELTSELENAKLAQPVELDPNKADFGRFQYNLSLHLTREIIQNLTLVLDFSPSEAEEVEQDKVRFIRHLKGKGLISCADIGPLLVALREINQHGVADTVEKMFQPNFTE